MPIPGRVDGNSRRMTVRINVSGDAGEYREMVFEVDTASDVQLALSAQDIMELGLEQAGNIDYRSNGTSHDIPRYVAYVEWHDGRIPVYVVETERPAYVGMGPIVGQLPVGVSVPQRRRYREQDGALGRPQARG